MHPSNTHSIIAFPVLLDGAPLPLDYFLAVPNLRTSRSRTPSRARASRSSRPTSRVRVTSTNARSTRVHHDKENVLPAKQSALDLSLDDEWWNENSFIESPQTYDYVEEYLQPVEKLITTFGKLQHDIDIRVGCVALLKTLNQLVKCITSKYTNETWLENAPPISIAQTLRRIKNWSKSLQPTGHSSNIDSPTKAISDAGDARLKAFNRKLQGIMASIDLEN